MDVEHPSPTRVRVNEQRDGNPLANPPHGVRNLIKADETDVGAAELRVRNRRT
jgi:hypothetical protein